MFRVCMVHVCADVVRVRVALVVVLVFWRAEISFAMAWYRFQTFMLTGTFDSVYNLHGLFCDLDVFSILSNDISLG